MDTLIFYIKPICVVFILTTMAACTVDNHTRTNSISCSHKLSISSCGDNGGDYGDNSHVGTNDRLNDNSSGSIGNNNTNNNLSSVGNTSDNVGDNEVNEAHEQELKHEKEIKKEREDV